MKLPVRLHALIKERLSPEIKSDIKPVSITKIMEKLEISEIHSNVSIELKDDAENINVAIAITDNPEKTSQTEIKLADFLKEVDNYDEALHQLNMEGEKHGILFKKGNIQYYSDGKLKYKQIICSHCTRHIPKPKEAKDSNEKLDVKEEKRCKSFYRFRYNKDGLMALNSFNEYHSAHEFKIKNQI